jgi:hypothetical protein
MRSDAFRLLVAGRVLAACSRSAAQPAESFTDQVSGFHDSRLGPRSEQDPVQALTRITRYQPGAAPGPNPAAVVFRFEMSRFPPGTSADDLLRLGAASARP